MKRISIALVGVAALLVGGVLFVVREPRSESFRNGAISSGVDTTGGRARPAGEPSDSPSSAQARSNNASSTNGRIRAGDPYYGTLSQEQAEWLNRNLYPTADEIRAAGSSFAALSANDFIGEPTPERLAKAETAALARPDLAEASKRYLGSAASLGSAYALEALGRVHARPPTASWVASEAYFMAAEANGNWSLAARPRPPLSDDLVALARMRAVQLRKNIESQRKARGLPPRAMDIRPGLDETLKAIEQRLRQDPAA